MTAPSVDVVIPTIGRSSLAVLLRALAAGGTPRPRRVFVVDDRRERRKPLPVAAAPEWVRERLIVLTSGGGGPAAARNCGWRASDAEWVACLDDDVVPVPGFCRRLHEDLAAAVPDVAASQGRVRVPVPADRRLTDRERVVLGLERARWASANMAYRRRVLDHVGGFDERFPRAFREDSDIGVRLVAAGYRIADGRRTVFHPVWPSPWWSSLSAQRGNADDALMRALHGPSWRTLAGAPRGRLRRHVAVTVAAVATAAAGLAGAPAVAAASGALALAGVAEFAWGRIRPGPRTPAEVAAMLATSVLIPPVAVAHRLRGMLRARRLVGTAPAGAPALVLFDRDGTLVEDRPCNADPDAVVPRPGARAALDRLRKAHARIAVVSNQAAVGEGRLGLDALAAVNERIERLLGPFDGWFLCLHAAGDRCGCRKPAPGLVRHALAAFGVPPARCALIGDIGADVDAARSAGVRAILVPTAATRPAEIDAADEVAPDLRAAVARLFGARG